MQITPKIRGFICTTAHPQGCAQNVQSQIDFARHITLNRAPRRVLVIGGSAGYGLSARIIQAVSGRAATLSVSYEKAGTAKRTASAGWYNNHFFEQSARKMGLYAKSINADAFSADTKLDTAQRIREDLGQIDLLVYSLAAPKRFDSVKNRWVSSSLKPIGQALSGQSVDLASLKLTEFQTEAATQAEIDDTVYVMGGSDWQDWVNYLKQENLLAQGCQTVAFSYKGGELTRSVYDDGTIGQAKKDVEYHAINLKKTLSEIGGDASVAVLKAIVTQSSSALPSFSLYISLLYQVMKEHGQHESCIEQIARLMTTGLYGTGCLKDLPYRYRLDDMELNKAVQEEVGRRWAIVTNENLHELGDVQGVRTDFHRLFGFDVEGVDYTQPVELGEYA